MDGCGWMENEYTCRLIPLDKNPGRRPIGVGGILRRIVGKAVVCVIRKVILSSVVSLKICAGHELGCEATVHAIRNNFHEQESKAVLLIASANAFN